MSKKNVTLALILVGLGFLIYSFNFNNKLFWDDDNWIVNNPSVHGLSWQNAKFWFQNNTLAGVGLKSNYYRPFLFFTFAVNYAVDGIKPLGYHLVSNGIHIANAVLIFFLLGLVFNKKWVGFLTALVFLVHPLQTEAVSYISGRGDPLSVFFMLLSLWLFVISETSGQRWFSWKKLVSYFLLALALLSREVAIIFPFLLMIFLISFVLKGNFLQLLKKAFVKAFPFFLIVFFYGILRLTVLNFDNTLNFYSTPNIYSANIHVRIFTFLEALAVYIKLLFVPVGLHMERAMEPVLNIWNWPAGIVILALAGLIYWLFFLYKKENPKLETKNQQLQTNFNVWFFGLSWFFAGLAPVSGITPINAIMYEHWLYLPLIGIFFIFCFYFEKLANYLKKNGRVVLFGLSLAAVSFYLLFFSIQSVKRNILWGKPVDFYLDILRYEPGSVRINNNLGNIYYDAGDKVSAEKHYKVAIASEDIFPQPHFNLGSILESRGDTNGAIYEYKRSIEIDPGFYYGYQNLASIYGKHGDLENTWLNVEKLLVLRPDDARMYYNAGLVRLAMKDKTGAREYVRRGLLLVGNDQEVKKLLDGLAAKLK